MVFRLNQDIDGNNNYQEIIINYLGEYGTNKIERTWLYESDIRPITDPKKVFGRQQELDELDKLFENGNHAIALIGIEGIGKSTLASKYIDRLTDTTFGKQPKYAGIFWRKIDEKTEVSDIVRSFFQL
jgi:hypothetical protein